jgi:hypothetical protein
VACASAGTGVGSGAEPAETVERTEDADECTDDRTDPMRVEDAAASEVPGRYE